MRILLHACCGPCSLEPTRLYLEEGADFSIFYSNPNIYPPDEYERRLDTLEGHVAKPSNIELVKSDYDPEAWEEQAAVFGLDREKRCRACYRLRFERLAAYAAENGFNAIDSTLSISPYQFTEAILEELERAAAAHGLRAMGRDYREHYAQATRTSREKGMYRQNYCGCRFSIAEAELERRERAEEHAKKKGIKQKALMLAAAEGIVNQATQL